MKRLLFRLLVLLTPACTTTKKTATTDNRYRNVECLCANGSAFSESTYRCAVLGSDDAIGSPDPENHIDPVCGCDGKAYRSIKDAWRNGVTFTRPGNCDGKMTYQTLLGRYEPVQTHCETTYEISSFDRSQLCAARGIEKGALCSKLHDRCYLSAPKSCAKGSNNWDLFPQQLHCTFRK